jgi:hypothetical protein
MPKHKKMVKVPKGYHRMPNGKIKKKLKHKSKRKRKSNEEETYICQT